jgi:hypothetical protein
VLPAPEEVLKCALPENGGRQVELVERSKQDVWVVLRAARAL